MMDKSHDWNSYSWNVSWCPGPLSHHVSLSSLGVCVCVPQDLTHAGQVLPLTKPKFKPLKLLKWSEVILLFLGNPLRLILILFSLSQEVMMFLIVNSATIVIDQTCVTIRWAFFLVKESNN
jgi:hypothetical protein